MNIVVIGGGVAGSTVSRLLAKNHNVTLIQDRKWDKPCGGGTKIRAFEEFDLDTSIIREKFTSLKMFYKNDEIDLDLLGENLCIVFREEFDEYLRNEAKNSGVNLIYDKFIKIEKNIAILKNNKIKFDILIAADGVNSTVRKHLGLKDIPKVLTYYARIDKKIEKPLFYFDRKFGDDFYAWEFPHNNQTHIGSEESSFDNFKKYLNIDIKNKGYFIPSWQKNIQIQKDNIYFVGDSAGQVMPLSFEGIYFAMMSAKILAYSIENNLDYKKEWNKRLLLQFKFMKMLENGMKNNILREIIMFSFKFKFIQKISVKMWLTKIKM